MPQLYSSRKSAVLESMSSTSNSGVKSSPPVDIAYNAWIVKDDLGNDVHEGEQVYVFENGATIHVDAAEDYLIEKLEAKYVDIINWAGESEGIFLLKKGTWMRADDVEDYFIEGLGAHVYERKSIYPKQK